MGKKDMGMFFHSQFSSFCPINGAKQRNQSLKFALFCRYGPLMPLQFNLIFSYSQRMIKILHFTLLLSALILVAQTAPISLDFNSFDASYSQDKKLRLTFRCVGGSGSYTFDFRNIPAEWKVSGNTITIENFSINTRQNWRFSIYVTDTQNNYLSQNLMLNFMGAYIGLTSITTPVTGQLDPPADQFSNNPFSIASQLNRFNQETPQNIQQASQQPAPAPAPQAPGTIQTTSQPASLGDLVGGYPGADPVDKLTTGFGVPTDSPLTADLIASSKAVYNPLRDSASAPSPYKDQKDLATKRQSQANQTIDGINSIISRLSATITRLQDDAKTAELDTNSSRLAVNDCDQQLYSLEDTKSKILNAIKDKESTLNQYNTEISKQDKVIETEVQKLNSLEDLRKKTESDTLPSSRALQNLQRTLDQCRSNLLKSSKESEQTKMELEKTQTEIKMLTIESSQASAKVTRLTSDLIAVREKIKSLTDQLNEAKSVEQTILRDKAKYEAIPKNNDQRVVLLQIKLNNITSSASSSQNAQDCKVYEGPIITVQNIISKDRERYNQVLAQVQSQKAVVQKAKNSSSELKKIVSSLPLQIKTLKDQTSTYDASINRTSYLCDDKITEYSKYAVALQSINQKIDSSKNDLITLNRQLQSALSQLNAATSSLNDILKNEASYLSRLPAGTIANGGAQSSTSTTRTPASGTTTTTTSSTSTSPLPSSSSSSSVSSSTTTTTTTTSSSSSSKNQNISIDDIINSVISQKATSSSSSNSVSRPSGSSGSASASSSGNSPASSSASASFGNDPNQFSIASFLTKSATDQPTQPSNVVGTAVPRNNLAAAAVSTPDIPPPTYQTRTSQPAVAASTPAPTSPARNPLSQNFNTIIGDDFKVSSKAGFKSAYVQDIKNFLRKVNINLANTNLIQNQNLFTLDATSLKSLLTRGTTQAALPSNSCSTSSLSDTAVVQDIGLGYILAKNSDTLFRLTLSDCTKIMSTATSGSLKQGSRIYFTGQSVVSIPNNVLLNANLVVCIPESA